MAKIEESRSFSNSVSAGRQCLSPPQEVQVGDTPDVESSEFSRLSEFNLSFFVSDSVIEHYSRRREEFTLGRNNTILTNGKLTSNHIGLNDITRYMVFFSKFFFAVLKILIIKHILQRKICGCEKFSVLNFICCKLYFITKKLHFNILQ